MKENKVVHNSNRKLSLAACKCEPVWNFFLKKNRHNIAITLQH